jgi:Fe-S oxidoreductase
LEAAGALVFPFFNRYLTFGEEAEESDANDDWLWTCLVSLFCEKFGKVIIEVSGIAYLVRKQTILFWIQL